MTDTVRLVAVLLVVGALGALGKITDTETIGLLSALIGYAFGQHSGEARTNAAVSRERATVALQHVAKLENEVKK